MDSKGFGVTSAAMPKRRIPAMAESERTSAQMIVEEIRRQVDLQVTAADALDTKAMAIFASAAGVAAFIAPRVTVSSLGQTAAAVGTLALLVGALICLLFAVRPRIGGFSNGPDVVQVAKRIDDPAGSLERELVPAFVGVRGKNESFLASKGDWTIRAMLCLIGTVVGVSVMVGVGASK